QRLKITQLVQFKNACVEELATIQISFIDQHFAPNDFIAGSGIALKVDSTDEELMALIDIDRQVDLILAGNNFRIGCWDEVDVTEIPIEFAQIVQTLLHLLRGKHIPGSHTKH